MDYDDAGVNAGSSYQSVTMTDLDFTWGGTEYTLANVTPDNVVLAYGQVTAFGFSTPAMPSVNVWADAGTLTVFDGSGQHNLSISVENNGPLALDTSDTTTGEAFFFTLSDGTQGQGSFQMNSSDVITSGSGYASLTDFSLTVGGTTYTATDCYSAPQAHFVSGQFVGLSYDIKGISGQTGFDELVGSDGILTPYLSAAAQVPKVPKWQTNTATLDFSTVTTGQAYSIKMTMSGQTSSAQIPLATITVNVLATDIASQIRNRIANSLRAAKIFEESVGTDQLLIGGNTMNTGTADGTYTLTKVEMILYTSMSGGFPVPDNTICGPTYAKWGGKTAPVVMSNNNTLTTP